MAVTLDNALRQLLADYAGLQAEQQRLIASPPDRATYAAHIGRLSVHVCRVQFVLEELRQQLTTFDQAGIRAQ